VDKLLILADIFLIPIKKALKSVPHLCNPCSKFIKMAHKLRRLETGFKKCYTVLFLTIILFLIIINTQAQSVQIVKWAAIDRIQKQMSDTTFVVHFWATWCAPCVKELPDFELVSKKYKNKKVKIILVSADFLKDKNKVLLFLKKHQIMADVWIMNEPDQNAWIEQIDKKWSGGLPASLLLNNKKQKKTFWEQSLNYNRLVRELSDFL
jgi:thiol-disulfide isomerase/thioredoxin